MITSRKEILKRVELAQKLKQRNIYFLLLLIRKCTIAHIVSTGVLFMVNEPLVLSGVVSVTTEDG
jgi:hypothetical protein